MKNIKRFNAFVRVLQILAAIFLTYMMGRAMMMLYGFLGGAQGL
jgi:hypothetical protein